MDGLQWNALDIMLIIVMLFVIIRATIKGFTTEFLGTAALVAGLGLAYLFSGVAGTYIDEYLNTGPWSQIIAFLGIFVLVYLIAKLSEGALLAAIEHAQLESLDHALGLFLGVAEAAVIGFSIIVALIVQPLFDADALLQGSVLARFSAPLLPWATEFVMNQTRGG